MKDLEYLEEISEDIIGFQTILTDLMNVQNNIEGKTDIKDPYLIAFFYSFAESIKYSKSKKVLNTFIDKYLKLCVSINRKGRTEIIQALTSWIEEKKKLINKLTSPKEE